jgi:hypothetical protein
MQTVAAIVNTNTTSTPPAQKSHNDSQTLKANHLSPPSVRGQKELMLAFTHCHVLGDRSNFEGVYQRCLMGGLDKVKCRKCRGSTFGNQPEIDRWHRAQARFHEAWREGAIRAIHAGREPDPERDYALVHPMPIPRGECSMCRGDGYTVRKTGGRGRSSTSSFRAPNLPAEGIILETAGALRVMHRLEREHRLHWGVLQAYHGTIGEYAAGKYGNRLIAVMALLPGVTDLLALAKPKVAGEGKRRAAAEKRRERIRAEMEEIFHAFTAAGNWSGARAARLAIDRQGRPPPKRDPSEIPHSVRDVLGDLHTLGTYLDERGVKFRHAEQDAFLLLVEAGRSWEGCFDA